MPAKKAPVVEAKAAPVTVASAQALPEPTLSDVPELADVPELETGSIHHGWVSNDRYKFGVFVTLDAADDLFGTLENGVMAGGRVQRDDKIWVEVIGKDINGLPSLTMLTVDQKTGKKL